MSDERLIELADALHQEFCELYVLHPSFGRETDTWRALGDLLDELKPVTFYRNTGELRGGS